MQANLPNALFGLGALCWLLIQPGAAQAQDAPRNLPQPISINKLAGITAQPRALSIHIGEDSVSYRSAWYQQVGSSLRPGTDPELTSRIEQQLLSDFNKIPASEQARVVLVIDSTLEKGIGLEIANALLKGPAIEANRAALAGRELVVLCHNSANLDQVGRRLRRSYGSKQLTLYFFTELRREKIAPQIVRLLRVSLSELGTNARHTVHLWEGNQHQFDLAAQLSNEFALERWQHIEPRSDVAPPSAELRLHTLVSSLDVEPGNRRIGYGAQRLAIATFDLSLGHERILYIDASGRPVELDQFRDRFDLRKRLQTPAQISIFAEPDLFRSFRDRFDVEKGRLLKMIESESGPTDLKEVLSDGYLRVATSELPLEGEVASRYKSLFTRLRSMARRILHLERLRINRISRRPK